MTPAQRDALDFAVGEVTRPLYDRIAELEADLKDAQEQAAVLKAQAAEMKQTLDAMPEVVSNMIADAYGRGLTDGAAELEPMRKVQEAEQVDVAANAYDRGRADGIAELEPMRPVLDSLHALLLKRDTVEYHPGRVDSPPLLRLGRASIFGLGAEELFAALRTAALEFTGESR